MAVVWSRLHALHEPADREQMIEQALHRLSGDDNQFTQAAETWVENPRRIEKVMDSLRGLQDQIVIVEAQRHTLEESVLLVHSAAFVGFVRRFWDVWHRMGEPAQFGDGETGLMPDTFRYGCCGGCASLPRIPAAMAAAGQPSMALLNQAGWYCFDRNAPIVEHTFVAACAAVDTALTAAKLLLRCGANLSYVYIVHASDCPWCCLLE